MSDLRAPSVLTSGYMALDVIQAPEGTWLRAGGTAANVAAILAYFGWRASVVGLLGNDDAGPLVEQDLRQAGVDTSRLQLRGDAGTPIVLHEIRASGHRFRFGCSVCGRPYRRHRGVSLVDIAHVTAEVDADVFFFDRPTPAAIEVAAAFRRTDRLVVYEPGSTGRAEAHRRSIALADIVKFSEERVDSFRDALPDPKVGQLWIRTAAERGATFRLGRGRWHHIEPFSVTATDAAGAGDWMTAAVVAGLGPRPSLTSAAVRRALTHAQAVAALSCLLPGARTLADALSVRDLLAEADRLASGEVPSLSYRGIVEAATGERCPHCQLPLGADVRAS